jgi:hypothetical protein
MMSDFSSVEFIPLPWGIDAAWDKVESVPLEALIAEDFKYPETKYAPLEHLEEPSVAARVASIFTILYGNNATMTEARINTILDLVDIVKERQK